jgi:hypothetical protein
MTDEGRLVSRKTIDPDPKSQWEVFRRLPLTVAQFQGLLDDLEQERLARLTAAAAAVPTPCDGELVRHSPEPERGE